MILGTSLLLLPMIALAQGQAPPEVDQELRARVSAFYQNFIDGSPRKAEEFVAEDTKDYYYNAMKRHYESFKILKVTYSDDFTKAVVLVAGKTETSMAGQKVVVDFPQDTRWKIEKGKWCWYYDPSLELVTPMSVGGKNPPPATGPAVVIPKNSSPEATRAAGLAVLKQQTMGLNKFEVTFTANQAGSGEVVFTNGADGEIQIALDAPVVRGLKATLDKTAVPGHGTAVLSLRYDPSDKTGAKGVWEPKGSILFRLYASPFDRIFPLSVIFIEPK